MSEPLCGRRFQVHLSTAVILMFVSGGLIWANVRVGRVESIGQSFSPTPPDASTVKENEEKYLRIIAEIPRAADGNYWLGTRYSYYGWPSDLLCSISHVRTTTKHVYAGSDVTDWRMKGIVINALAALVILFAVWFLCEWWIRRHAARKGI